MKRYVREGDVIPWGYGVAWRDLYSPRFVCFVFPLNRVLAFVRSTWYKIRDVPWSEVDKKAHEIYSHVAFEERLKMQHDVDVYVKGFRSGWEGFYEKVIHDLDLKREELLRP